MLRSKRSRKTWRKKLSGECWGTKRKPFFRNSTHFLSATIWFGTLASSRICSVCFNSSPTALTLKAVPILWSSRASLRKSSQTPPLCWTAFFLTTIAISASVERTASLKENSTVRLTKSWKQKKSWVSVLAELVAKLKNLNWKRSIFFSQSVFKVTALSAYLDRKKRSSKDLRTRFRCNS